MLDEEEEEPKRAPRKGIVGMDARRGMLRVSSRGLVKVRGRVTFERAKKTVERKGENRMRQKIVPDRCQVQEKRGYLYVA